MIKFGKNDVLVVEQGGKKWMGRAISPSMLDLGETELRFGKEEVIACLGQNPPAGQTVYGKKIDYIRAKATAGPIRMQFHTEVVVEDYVKAVHDSVKALRKAGLGQAVSLVHEIHVRNPAKRMYSFKQCRDEARTGILSLNADDVWAPHALIGGFALAAFQEFADRKLRSQWLARQQKLIRVSTCTQQDLRDIYDTYCAQETPDIKGLHNLIPEGSIKVVQTIIAHFRQHGMSVRDIDVLALEDQELLGKMWPEWASFCDQRPDYPEGALASVDQLFAHGVQQLCLGTVPDTLRKPLAYTIKSWS